MTTDWLGSCGTVMGTWKPPRSLEHLNVLKLRTFHLGLRGLLPFLHQKHVSTQVERGHYAVSG